MQQRKRTLAMKDGTGNERVTASVISERTVDDSSTNRSTPVTLGSTTTASTTLRSGSRSLAIPTQEADDGGESDNYDKTKNRAISQSESDTMKMMMEISRDEGDDGASSPRSTWREPLEKNDSLCLNTKADTLSSTSAISSSTVSVSGTVETDLLQDDDQHHQQQEQLEDAFPRSAADAANEEDVFSGSLCSSRSFQTAIRGNRSSSNSNKNKNYGEKSKNGRYNRDERYPPQQIDSSIRSSRSSSRRRRSNRKWLTGRNPLPPMASPSVSRSWLRNFSFRCGRPGNQQRQQQEPTHSHHSSTIWIFRIVFIGFLCLVAAGLGTGVYFLERNAEYSLATSQFQALVDRAINSARDITNREVLGLITVARMYSMSFSDPAEWPYVHLHGFDEIGSNMLATTRGRGYAFAPIVQPSEREQFEAWAKTKIPNGAGVSSFGYGIFAFDDSLNNTDGRYHDTTGNASWGSPNDILIPSLQYITTNAELLLSTTYLLNFHSLESHGVAIDASLECAEERRGSKADHPGVGNAHCGTLTDIMPPFGLEEPGAVMMLPIFPANDPNKTVVGFVGSSILWQSALQGAFNSKVSGIDVVLYTSVSETRYTFRIVDGVPHYRGAGDYHDPKYESYRQKTLLTESTAFQNLSSSSPEYYMHIYPSDDYFSVFATSNPIYATIGTVIIIVVTSVLFFLYDALVTKENRKNHEIIEGRRRFMRFVSHEVRTPLNSVCMGLKLLREELTTLFGDRLDTDTTIPTIMSEEALDALTLDHQADSEDLATKRQSHGIQNKKIVVETTPEAMRDMVYLSKQISSSATSAIEVLNDVLNYDKIETGRLHLEKTLLDIWELMDQVITEFHVPFKTKHVDLVVDWTGSNLDVDEETGRPTNEHILNQCVLGDIMKITLVFRNLLSNALKFTPDGGKVTLRPKWIEFDSHEIGKQDEIQLSNDAMPPQQPIIKKSMARILRRLSSSDPDNEVEDEDPTDYDSSPTFPRGGTLKISISHTCLGMSTDQIHHRLFKAGVQFQSNKLEVGQESGLGLFIAKSIMRRHGGDLLAETDGLECGSTFVATIPMYQVPGWRSDNVDVIASTAVDSVSSSWDGSTHADKFGDGSRRFDLDACRRVSGSAEHVPSCAKESTSTLPGKRQLRILVVDDALTNRKLLARLLQKQGHICEQAQDGQEAFDKVATSWEEHCKLVCSKNGDDDDCCLFDAILMDYEMPVMDGPTSVQKMKQQFPQYFCTRSSSSSSLMSLSSSPLSAGQKKRCLVMGITGNVLPEDVAHFKKCGADDVLPKPLDMPALTSALVNAGLLSVVLPSTS